MSRLLTPILFLIIGFLSAIFLPIFIPSLTDLTDTITTTSTPIAYLFGPPKQPPTANMSEAFLSLVRARRSFYPLTKSLAPLSPTSITSIVHQAIEHTPTSFNGQTNRAVVLFGAEHDKFWEITREVLREVTGGEEKLGAEEWGKTNGKMDMFKGAGGTVLFYEHMPTVTSFQNNIPAYAPKFPIWSTQGSAMLQFVIWTALEAEGLGANLQHYDPVIDEKVAAVKEWGVEEGWKLNAQLVFGGRVGEAGAKSFAGVEGVVKVCGA